MSNPLTLNKNKLKNNPLNQAYFDKVEDLESYAEVEADQDEDEFMSRSHLSIRNLAVKDPIQAVDKLS